MRKVTLYTLNSQDVMVSGDHVSFCGSYERPVHVRYLDEFIVNPPIEVKQVPVDRYIVNTPYGKEECLVAFDPKIRDLLDSDREKIRGELEQTKTLYKDCLTANKVFSSMNTELSEENKRMKYLIKDNEDEIRRLSEGLQIFYNMSFWKRLVYLLVGKIKENK